jgi:murein DD-endopeptidase MepM/ murein hydrolase activator NlpD
VPKNDSTPAQWAASVLKGLGIHQTPGAIQALVGWARAEGGHYGGILHALAAGDPHAVAKAIDQSPWGTHGSLVYNAISSAPKVSGAQPYGPASSPKQPQQGGQQYGTQTTTIPGVDNSLLRRQLVGQFLQQGGVNNPQAVLSLAGAYAQAKDVPGTTTTTYGQPSKPQSTPPSSAPGGARISPHARPGDPVVSSKQSEGGLHETSGLPGYPAHDLFAPAGTHAVAPVSGTVIRLSGHDPAQGPTQGPHGPLGYSVYIKGDDGKTYFLTHMGSRNVKPGQKVRQGQIIGTVANYDKYGTPSHIHEGVSG